MNEEQDPLIEILTEHGYAPVFGEVPDQLLIDSIKSEPDIALRLQSIVNNLSIHWQARFMASEFLFRYVDMVLHKQCDRKSLQDSYLQALSNNFTGNGLDWGFGKNSTDIGILGLMVVSWGSDLEAFKAGLNDNRLVTINHFWRTPPHFHPPYRVKDFVALILARVHELAIDLAGSPEDRDIAIAELIQTMESL